MKIRNLLFVAIGILIGWATVPCLNADPDGNTYKALLHKLIGIVQQIQIEDQQIADNTAAIKNKLGAK